MSIWQRLVGGWKTWGPGAIVGDGGFASDGDSPDDAITMECALRLSAVWACINLRAETIGTMPLHLRDDKKKVLVDHDLYGILHDSPNADMTAAEFWSLQSALIDMRGNALSFIEKNSRNRIISLNPLNPEAGCTIGERKNGKRMYKIGQDEYPDDRILHLKGFSTDGLMGLPRIDVGRQILRGQLSANNAAANAFKQGLKVGGFFQVEGNGQNLTEPQALAFKAKLDQFADPKNAGRWMTLPKFLKPIAGAEFRVKPVDAELLQSRYFGIEEICRLFNTPPPLIGHTDKASSWASSLETLNLMFLMYGLQPTFIRAEQSIAKKLLSTADRVAKVTPNFNIQGLLRADMKTQQAFFASALQNGYYNRNEVRDMLDRGTIPGGEDYTIQLNMQSADNAGGDPGSKKP